MAAEGWCGLLGSTPSLIFNFFLGFLSVSANVFPQKYSNLKKCLNPNQKLNNRYRENGYVWTLLFCLRLLIAPPVHGICLASNQSSTPGLSFPLINVNTPSLTYFGHGYLATYSTFWQKGYYNEKDNKQTTKRSKQYACSVVLFLLLLSGDVQLNPGPIGSSTPRPIAQLDTAEATLVQHDYIGGTEPLDAPFGTATWSSTTRLRFCTSCR